MEIGSLDATMATAHIRNLDQLGDEIVELSAHLDAATAVSIESRRRARPRDNTRAAACTSTTTTTEWWSFGDG